MLETLEKRAIGNPCRAHFSGGDLAVNKGKKGSP
jgi:hypothetical protein